MVFAGLADRAPGHPMSSAHSSMKPPALALVALLFACRCMYTYTYSFLSPYVFRPRKRISQRDDKETIYANTSKTRSVELDKAYTQNVSMRYFYLDKLSQRRDGEKQRKPATLKTPLASSYRILFVGDAIRLGSRRLVGNLQHSMLVIAGDPKVSVIVQSDSPKRYRRHLQPSRVPLTHVTLDRGGRHMATVKASKLNCSPPGPEANSNRPHPQMVEPPIYTR